MAAFSQFEQCPAQRLKRFGLAAQFLGAGDGEGLYLGAGTLAVAPQPQQTSDILDRKAEVTGIGDEPQTKDIGIRIVAIAAVPALRRRDQNRSEEHPSELQALMRSSYAVVCLKKKNG